MSVDKLLDIARSDRGWYVRTTAIRSLWRRIKEPRVPEGLIGLLEDNNVAVRQAAIRTLHLADRAYISDEARTAIRPYCEDDDPEVATWANLLLWKLGDKDALRRLFESLSGTVDFGTRIMISATVKTLDRSLGKDEFLDRDGEALSRKWLAWWENHRDEISWNSEKKTFVMKAAGKHKDR